MKKINIILLFSAVVFLFVSCQKNDTKNPQVSSKLIGIAMPETHVQRWVKDGASLKRFAESRGYRAEVSFGNADQRLQNEQIKDFLNQGANLIIIGSVNEEVVSAVAEAARKKVPVISYDRIISNSSDYDYYITFNNYEVGQLQGRSVEQGLDLKNANASNPLLITLFAGAPTDGNAFFFFDGAMSILNPYIEKGALVVVGPYPKTSKDSALYQSISTDNWQASVARARMKNLLENDAKNVVLDAVLAPNDTLARAVISACLEDPKYSARLPLITGQDAEADSIVAIRKDQQYMTIFKDTTKLAEAAITLADEILNGKPEPTIPGAVLAAGDLLSIGDTGKKIVKTFLLEPVFINKDNWNIPVQAGFYTVDEEIRFK